MVDAVHDSGGCCPTVRCKYSGGSWRVASWGVEKQARPQACGCVVCVVLVCGSCMPACPPLAPS